MRKMILRVVALLVMVPATFVVSSAASAENCTYVPGSCQSIVYVIELPDELKERSVAQTVVVDGVRRPAECARLSLNQTLCVVEPLPVVQTSSVASPVPSFTG